MHSHCRKFTCEVCGQSFELRISDIKQRLNGGSRRVGRWCNRGCYRKAVQVKRWSSCLFCETSFKKERNSRKFCSRACSAKFRKGQPFYCKDKELHRKNTSQAMRTAEVQKKIRAPRSPMSAKRKQEVSALFAGKMPKNLQRPGRFGNVRRGFYDINGKKIFCRSMWEANYCLYLDHLKSEGKIISWEHEPRVFVFEAIKFGTRSYTPDFMVRYPDGHTEWHEVKGCMTARSKTQIKRMKKYFPKEILILIEGREYKEILKFMKYSTSVEVFPRCT